MSRFHRHSLIILTVVLLLAMVYARASAAGPRDEEDATEGVSTTLVLEPGEGNPRNSEGDFIQLEDGRILFAYTHFTGSASDFGAAHVAGRYSSDGGKTWSGEDTVIVSNEGGMNTMSVSLLRLDNGEIGLFYLRKDSRADCRLHMRVSNDEAQTWSGPRVCIEPPGYYVVNNDRVIQLKTGRLVIPAARHSLPGQDFQHRGAALCYLSDDRGETWQRSDTILEAPPDSRSGLQEPGVIELKDGRLMMLARTDQGSQFRSYSSDAGITWSPAEPSDLVSPVSPATFERIPKTGDILLAWNNHKGIDEALRGKRTPFTVAISRDEGQTWEHVKNIEDDPHGWYCYTAMEFVGDCVLLGHCAGDRRTGGLNRTQVLRIDIDWLYR